jgi:hypothetical protein
MIAVQSFTAVAPAAPFVWMFIAQKDNITGGMNQDGNSSLKRFTIIQRT